MLFALVTILMFVGLYCFGLAVRCLWMLDWAATQPQFEEEEKKKDDGPHLTRLGRPNIEIKLSA